MNLDKVIAHHKDRIGTISASVTGLDTSMFGEKRMNYIRILHSLDQSDPLYSFFEKKKNELPEITEDSGSGMLNNIIAGRINNYFDLKGKSYNIDADYCSIPYAYSAASLELRSDLDMVIVLSIKQSPHPKNLRVITHSVEVDILTTYNFARSNSLPILNIIEGVEYDG